MDTLKKLAKELWEEFGLKAVAIFGVVVVIFIGGGVYRLSNDEPFWGKPESETERRGRLLDCAQVADEQLSPAQQMDSGNAGVCSGFSKSEIEHAQAVIGL